MLWHLNWCDSSIPSSGLLFDLRKRLVMNITMLLRRKAKQKKLPKSCLADNVGLWGEVKKFQNASHMSPTIIDGQCNTKDIAESKGNK